MARKIIGTTWDRDNRNNMNDNFEEVYGYQKMVNEAKTIAGEADAKSEKALSNSETTQEQLDQVVIDGDSSVEAAQARVDTDGNSHQTLKERLDTEHSEVSSQLAHTAYSIEQRSLNVKDFGALGDGSNDDTLSIQNAIDSLGDVGGTVIIPRGIYRTNKTIIVPGKVTIKGVGKGHFGSLEGTVVRPLMSFEDDTIIRLGTSSDRSIGAMNFTVDGGVANITHGVLADDSTNNVKMKHLHAINCLNGFTFAFAWNISAELLTTHNCTNGFRFIKSGMTSSTLLDCVAYGCDEVGFYLEDTMMHYSSLINCGVDDSDIGFKITSDIFNCGFYNCGSENHRAAVHIDHPDVFVNLNGFSHAASIDSAIVFEIENARQFNLIGVNMKTNHQIFSVNESNVEPGAIKLFGSNIRTIDGRSMGNVNCVVDTDKKSTFNNPVNMSVFEDRDVISLKTAMRINRRMKIVLPVEGDKYWASLRIISHGFANADSVETGGLITLAAFNNAGEILHRHTNTNESTYVDVVVVGNTVEYVISFNYDGVNNFTISEIEGYCYKNDIKIYQNGEF